MKKIFLLICFIFLLSGCYDYKELNDMSIISGIGVDFIDNEYEVILEITNSNKDGSSNELETSIVSAKDENISVAFNKAKNKTDKDVYLEHVELLVIGSNIAEYGVNELFDYIIRDTTINSNYFVAVCDNVKEILNTKLENKSVSSLIVDTISYTQGNTKIDDLDILVSKYITGKEDIALPFIKLDKDKFTYEEVAYFDKDKMVGKIDYKMYSFLVLDTKNILFTSQGNTISITNKDISMNVKENKIIIDIIVDGLVMKINNDINLKDKDGYKKLEKLLNEEIKKESIIFIDTIIKDQSDLLGFKNTYYKKKKRNINKFDYEINIESNIKKNGTIYEVIHVN